MKKKLLCNDGRSFCGLSRLIRIMKLTTFLLLVAFVGAQARGLSQTADLNLKVQEQSVKDVLRQIEDQSDYFFMYNDTKIDVQRKVNLDLENEKISEVLDALFEGTNTKYVIKNRQIVLYPKGENQSLTNQQVSEVSGVVSDSQGPLPGVTVVVKGTTQGTVTDLDGKYTISNLPDNAVLVFSFVGMKPKEVPARKSTINVTMEESSIGLDEVVAVGYGTVKRGNLTGSISSMSGEDLQKIPIANAAEAIKGRLPGVNVLTVDGSPDAEVVIRVRGGGSVTQDNSPLFVVDGFIVSSIRDVPPNDIASINVLKDAAATAIYGAQASNGVILITTKSPKAGKTTVSYNGYLQLKTLPSERKYDVLGPYDFVMMQYEHAKVRSETDLRNFEKYYGKYDDLELYKNKPGTDWQEELFGGQTDIFGQNVALSQSHNISVSGGTQQTKVSLSLTNDTNDGLMVNNGYRRNVINFKLNHSISESLKLETSARITDTKVDGAGTSGGANIRVKNVITARPVNGIADELDIDLTSIDSSDDYQSFLLSLINPIELAKQDWRQKNTMNYVLQAGLSWYPIDNMILRSTVTSSKTFEEQLRYYGPLTSQSRQEGNSLPLGTMDNRENESYRLLNTASYTFENMGEHALDLLVGNEIYSNGGKRSIVRAENFRESMQPEEMFANMALGTTDSYSTSQSTDQTRISFFGRANYQFKDRYLITTTLRTDASSKFSKENRLGVFPAVALGWKINEEYFMNGFSNLNELKLRYSFGATGNDRIPANATKFLFEASTNNGPGMGTNSYNAYYSPEGSTLFNPNIVWETTINQNLGLDWVLYNGAIRGTLDLYYNKTKDLLLAQAISPISGFATQWNNVGSTSNKGIELLLSGYIIDKSDFTLTANLNFGINKANIDKLEYDYLEDENGNLVPASRFYQSNWSSTDLKDRDDFYLEVDQTIGLIYGYVNDGMYTVDDFSGYDEVSNTYALKDGIPDNKNTLGVSDVRPGYMKLKDLNDDGEINSQDRQVIGSALPDATGGFGFDATFKGFDASILFNWSIGNDVYNTGKIDYNQLYRTRYGNMLTTMSPDNRFTYIDVDGTYTGTAGEVVTDLEQLGQLNADKEVWSGSNSFGQATTVISDWAVEDGSFLRLNNLTLGYTVPKTLTSRIGVSQFRVYATGNNLWLWTKYSGYDPEVSTTRSSSYAALTPGVDYSSYPRSRSFTFGVNVTF
ncbi:TonB-dependent receptor [Sunxiuqinia indica]|uniref:TonB-dependent receptor n=1 Tax=Sunxiuqinia indica TaxID=2692584 RepID=UPI001F25B8A5|nr:TonB-dependent receptor [Sunxiuqinia indica]